MSGERESPERAPIDRPCRLGAVVLCGGESSRMGSPKAWLDFGGEPLLRRVVRAIDEVCRPIVVVAAPGQDLPLLPEGIEIARDPVAGRGPLQGIAAGLAAIGGRADAAFVSATDAPFLHPALVRRLFELLTDAHDVAVPRVGGRLHVLSSVVRCSVRADIEALLAADRRRASLLVEGTRALIADEALLLAGAELAAADPALRSLRNINTPQEYEAALAEALRDPAGG